MQTQFYFLSPVEVVKVTSNNLEEVAKWCGGKVAETESRRVKGRMDKYVWVPTPKGNNISWAFPGMFITKRLVVTLKDEFKTTFSVFKREYFGKNYFESPEVAVDQTWEAQQREAEKPKPTAPKRRPEVVVNVNVGDALSKALDKNNDFADALDKAEGGIVEQVKKAVVKAVDEEIQNEDLENTMVSETLADGYTKAKHATPVPKEASFTAQAYPDGKCNDQCEGGHPLLKEAVVAVGVDEEIINNTIETLGEKMGDELAEAALKNAEEENYITG